MTVAEVLQDGIERYACHDRSQELLGGIPTDNPRSAESASAQRMRRYPLWHKFHTMGRVTMFLFRSRLIAIQIDTPKQDQVTDMISCAMFRPSPVSFR